MGILSDSELRALLAAATEQAKGRPLGDPLYRAIRKMKLELKARGYDA